ncbi:putative lipid-binding transport protein (Tim44 family) [Sphingomonas jejuensis]|uniref:Lipid-binding transport protein (Tim44 family) n=1 Tax=Sphingomonas jejuensis TaxID=904715 RepID=A0ABX0XIR3_9SPHN|nr:putative lipid-binding transport protein (Tim44 family) [Sphingomonas jejuensis]
MVAVVLIAMVAAFLALRLYMVLGKRSGHEESFPTQAEDRAVTQGATRPVTDAVPPKDGLIALDSSVEPGAAAGLRQIAQAENGFDAAAFLDGSKSAYRMILEAYWKGDEEQLGWLTDADVRESFSEAIAARRAAGEVLDNRLVTIEKAVISAASVEGRTARITVRFDADIAAVTRDSAGNVINGSMDDAVPTHDVWTFARPLKSNDPNWLLVETDEAS